MTQDQINIIKKQISLIEQSLAEIKRHLGSAPASNNHPRSNSGARKPESKLEQPMQDYSDVEGVVGKFDGVSMVTMEGQKYEVPANYAAKSKLVFGDTLKLIQEDGKQLYKHIHKVPRQKFEGILTKKDGLWFVLTDRGSYKISDVAAEFQKAEINDQVILLLPADNLDAPYATLDEVVKPVAPDLNTAKSVSKASPSIESPILSPTYSGMPSISSSSAPASYAPTNNYTQPTASSIADDDLV